MCTVFYAKNEKSDGFCITNDDFCINNDEFCITNDDFGATSRPEEFEKWIDMYSGEGYEATVNKFANE